MPTNDPNEDNGDFQTVIEHRRRGRRGRNVRRQYESKRKPYQADATVPAAPKPLPTTQSATQPASTSAPSAQKPQLDILLAKKTEAPKSAAPFDCYDIEYLRTPSVKTSTKPTQVKSKESVSQVAKPTSEPKSEISTETNTNSSIQGNKIVTEKDVGKIITTNLESKLEVQKVIENTQNEIKKANTPQNEGMKLQEIKKEEEKEEAMKEDAKKEEIKEEISEEPMKDDTIKEEPVKDDAKKVEPMKDDAKKEEAAKEEAKKEEQKSDKINEPNKEESKKGGKKAVAKKTAKDTKKEEKKKGFICEIVSNSVTWDMLDLTPDKSVESLPKNIDPPKDKEKEKGKEKEKEKDKVFIPIYAPVKLNGRFNEITININESNTVIKGMINTKRSCFMNSLLQILLCTPPFYSFITQLMQQKYVAPSESILCQIMELFQYVMPFNQSKDKKSVYSQNYINTETVFTSILRVFNPSGLSQDSHEFFMFILDALHSETSQEAISENKEEENKWIEVGDTKDIVYSNKEGGEMKNSNIFNIFGVTTIHEIDTEGKGKKKGIFQSNFDISLELKKDCYIKTMLSSINSFEQIEGYSDDKGVPLVASERQTISKLPLILTLHIKRLFYNKEKKQLFKNNDQIFFDEYLIIPPEIMSAHLKAQHKDGVKYELFGVIIHHGKFATRGHYTSYVKDTLNEWHYCDDKYTKIVTLDDVLDANPYMLFYRTAQLTK